MAAVIAATTVVSGFSLLQTPLAQAADPGCSVRNAYDSATPSYDRLWFGCTTTVAGAKSFRAEVAETNSMTPIVSTAVTNNTLPTATPIPNLIEGRNYYWRITAYSGKNASGSVLYTSAVGGPVAPYSYNPDPITNLLFTPQSSNTVTASWNTPVVNTTKLDLRLFTQPKAAAVNSPDTVLSLQTSPYCPPKGQNLLPGNMTLTAADLPGISASNRLFFASWLTYRCDGPARTPVYPTYTAGADPYPTPTTRAEFNATVMSFNTMLQDAADQAGAPGWSQRLPVLASQIKGADIVGAQELKFGLDKTTNISYAFDLATASGLTVAQKGTPSNPLPCGNDQGTWGSAEPILYNAGKFSLAQCGGETLPGAAAIHIEWAVLTDKASGDSIFVLNTHLIVGDQNAAVRAQAAKDLTTRLNAFRSDPAIAQDMPVIVTGDFNSWETEQTADGSISPATIVEQNNGLIGADWTAAQRTNITYPSMIAWRDPTTDPKLKNNLFGERLDHILLDQNIVATSFEVQVPKTVSHATMGSDHAPIKASITVYAYAPPTGPATPPPPTQPACKQFSDVPTSYTFYASICWASANGITKGTGDGSTYSPLNPVNRGSMAAFMYRLAGSPAWSPPAVSPFVDVKTTDTFYSAITWLAYQKITVGWEQGGQWYYLPNNAVNRGSMAAFMYRLAGSPAWQKPAASPFIDVAPDHTFFSSITWLADKQITVGVATPAGLAYQPGNPVNRGSMAAFMSRLSRTQLPCLKFSQAVGCATR